MADDFPSGHPDDPLSAGLSGRRIAAKSVNDDARILITRGASPIFASKLAPTEGKSALMKNPAALAYGVFGVTAQRLMMLTGRAEFHVGPALFHQRQVDPGRGQVGQVTAAVEGEVFHGSIKEFLELLYTSSILSSLYTP